MAERKKKRISQKEKNRINTVLKRLDDEYGVEIATYLSHKSAFELLVATMLSAQCTDARVNMVTPALFDRYPFPQDFAEADITELENYIRSTGFYHNKAKNIIECCKMLVNEYNSEVPSDIDELVKLPGVGRKTANVVRGNVFNQPSIVVDTHVKRVSGRLGFTKETDPVKVEFDLMDILPEENWIRYNIQIIALGRAICKAPKARCRDCFLIDLCPSGAV